MSMIDRIRAGEFKTKLPYPERPVLLGHRRPVADFSPDELREMADLKEAYLFSLTVWESEKEAYRQDEQRLMALFKVEALAEAGLTDHPRAEVVWDKAWNRGHSEGLESVMYELNELAEVLG